MDIKKVMQKQKQNLKISVITPSFNSSKYIERAIKSVMAQDYKNFEHIVIDGKSTDNTVDILKKYKHLLWISEPDNGETEAMIKGFKRSIGDIIVYLNSDDYFFPGSFSTVIREFEKGADFVLGNVLVKSLRLGSEFINVPRITLDGMLRHWEPNAFCHNPVGYFYTRNVQKLCPFNSANHVSMDLEFLLEAASKFHFVRVNQTLGCFEDGTDTTTGKTQSKLDYWRPETFPYIDKYLGSFSEEKRIEFLNDRRKGYAMMQAHMNRLNEEVFQSLPIKDLPSVSIIVPAYNCSSSVCRATDSVLSQGLKNIEIIIVDDASTDNTGEVLDAYYGKNSLVKIIRHPINKKLGAARNTGLEAAKGKYVFFLDADDWLENGSLARLMSISEKYGAEMVACGVDKVWDGGRSETYHSEAFSCAGGREALQHFADYRIGSIVWNKLYLREFIEKNDLRFIVPYFHEDVMFTTNAVYLCKKYVSIGNRYYKYFQRAGSIVSSRPTELHLRSYIKLYIDMSDFIERNKICKDEQGKILSQALLRAHCSNEIFPKLLHYVDTRTREEWEHECNSACIAEFGAKGFATANFVIEAMRNMKRHVPINNDRTGDLSLKSFMKRRFSSVVYGRFRRPLRKAYHLLGLDMLK